MVAINTDYFCELVFGNDFVTNNPMVKSYQMWYTFFVVIKYRSLLSFVSFLSNGSSVMTDITVAPLTNSFGHRAGVTLLWKQWNL